MTNPHVHFTHEDSPYFKDLLYLSEDFKRELNERCLLNFQVFVRESEIKLAIENLVGTSNFQGGIVMRRYNNLIQQHEEATKRFARTDTHAPEFSAAHNEFCRTGLALDEYVSNLEQLAENQQRDAERLAPVSHQSESGL